MAIQTPNYNLKKPVGNEFYNIEDANANMDIIDEALKAINDKTSNIEVPVTSVNTKTGDVVLKAIDIKASDDKTVEEKLAENSTQMAELEQNKVDKIAGKGLSTNDYTTTEKNKLAGIEAGARKLSNVQDYGIATQAEAEAGTVNNKYITPLRASQAVRSQTGSTYGSASLSQRIESKTEHTFTIPITPNSRNAKVFMYDGRLLVFCNTIPAETVALSISYNDKMLTVRRRGDTDFLHSFNSMVIVRAVHIEENNLKIIIHNDNTGATNHSVDIFWEAW